MLTVDKMDRFYDFFELDMFMSRADFYQLVVIAGIENGMSNAGIVAKVKQLL